MHKTLDPMSILVVDDDDDFRGRLGRAFEDRGLAVALASDHGTAMRMANMDPPELAVVDLKMPGRSGMEVVRDLRAIDTTTRMVVLTGYGSIATAVEAVKLGATNYLSKPVDADEVLSALGVLPAWQAGENEKSGREEPGTPSLARAEWEHINRVLADCDGNVSAAARRLGIHRRSLQRKLWKQPPPS
jgi:two-component system response regulator RegA